MFSPFVALHAVIHKYRPEDVLEQVGIQKGETLVFLRQQAFDVAERLRSQKIDTYAIKIQGPARAFVARAQFLRFCAGMIALQSRVRGVIARKAAGELAEEKRRIEAEKARLLEEEKKAAAERAAKVAEAASGRSMLGCSGQLKVLLGNGGTF